MNDLIQGSQVPSRRVNLRTTALSQYARDSRRVVGCGLGWWQPSNWNNKDAVLPLFLQGSNKSQMGEPIRSLSWPRPPLNQTEVYFGSLSVKQTQRPDILCLFEMISLIMSEMLREMIELATVRSHHVPAKHNTASRLRQVARPCHRGPEALANGNQSLSM